MLTWDSLSGPLPVAILLPTHYQTNLGHQHEIYFSKPMTSWTNIVLSGRRDLSPAGLNLLPKSERGPFIVGSFTKDSWFFRKVGNFYTCLWRSANPWKSQVCAAMISVCGARGLLRARRGTQVSRQLWQCHAISGVSLAVQIKCACAGLVGAQLEHTWWATNRGGI